jgi:hypothetical protein
MGRGGDAAPHDPTPAGSGVNNGESPERVAPHFYCPQPRGDLLGPGHVTTAAGRYGIWFVWPGHVRRSRVGSRVRHDCVVVVSQATNSGLRPHTSLRSRPVVVQGHDLREARPRRAIARATIFTPAARSTCAQSTAAHSHIRGVGATLCRRGRW